MSSTSNNVADLYSGPLTDKQKSLLAQAGLQLITYCLNFVHCIRCHQATEETKSCRANENDSDTYNVNIYRKNVSDLFETRPELDDDETLLRWIRAREWDLKKSEKMLRDAMLWRKNYGADTLLQWDVPEVCLKYYAGNFFGHDKEGFPVWYEMAGYIDLKGFQYAATRADIVKYHIYKIEHLFTNIFPERSRKTGNRIDKCSVIMDMEGIGFKHLSIPVANIVRDLLTLIEANYPETLRTAYVVNAHSLLPVFYNMLKPFLAEYTRSKIRFLGSNWKEELLKDFDKDQVPVHFGGTATDPDGDPFCKSQFGLGGTVPESLYLKNAAMDKFDMSQFTTVTVGRGQSLQLDYNVDTPGSIIRWNFWTESKDLAFGVFRRTLAAIRQKVDEMETVLPNTRVSCHVVPETGSFECEQPGTYVIRFDNTYSWMSSKKLSYLVEIMLPAQESLDMKQ